MTDICLSPWNACTVEKTRDRCIQKMKKYTSAARSTKNIFDQNSALQAACDTSIARGTGCAYPREGCRSVTPLIVPGSTGLKTFNLVLRTETVSRTPCPLEYRPSRKIHSSRRVFFFLFFCYKNVPITLLAGASSVQLLSVSSI